MNDNKKEERKRLSDRAGIKIKRKITQRQHIFAKILPISKTAEQAAVDAGYSEKSARTIAYANMQNEAVVALVEKNMKQCLNDSGLTNENLAEKFQELIYYNSEKVWKPVGESGKMIEEMRDARVVANTLANVVKFKGASLENTASNIISDVNADTAWLAIKSLVRKLSVEQVKQLRDSCDAMLESKSSIVSEA